MSKDRLTKRDIIIALLGDVVNYLEYLDKQWEPDHEECGMQFPPNYKDKIKKINDVIEIINKLR